MSGCPSDTTFDLHHVFAFSQLSLQMWNKYIELLEIQICHTISILYSISICNNVVCAFSCLIYS